MPGACLLCGKDKSKALKTFSDSMIFDGLCESCRQNRENRDISSRSFLEILSSPVLMAGIFADTYIIVKAVNKSACEKLGKESQEIVQHLIGNVLECIYAQEQEGCGRAFRCSDCLIRRAVMNTYKTGEHQSKVPASFKREVEEKESVITLSLTTVRWGDSILLQMGEFR